MPEITPAEELRTAAAALRSAVDDTPLCQHPGCGHYGGYHVVDGDGLTVCRDCDYDAHAYVSPGFEMPDGIGTPLADLLEAVSYSDDLTQRDHDGCDATVCQSWAALKVARRINAVEETAR